MQCAAAHVELFDELQDQVLIMLLLGASVKDFFCFQTKYNMQYNRQLGLFINFTFKKVKLVGANFFGIRK